MPVSVFAVSQFCATTDGTACLVRVRILVRARVEPCILSPCPDFIQFKSEFRFYQISLNPDFNNFEDGSGF